MKKRESVISDTTMPSLSCIDPFTYQSQTTKSLEARVFQPKLVADGIDSIVDIGSLLYRNEQFVSELTHIRDSCTNDPSNSDINFFDPSEAKIVCQVPARQLL